MGWVKRQSTNHIRSEPTVVFWVHRESAASPQRNQKLVDSLSAAVLEPGIAGGAHQPSPHWLYWYAWQSCRRQKTCSIWTQPGISTRCSTHICGLTVEGSQIHAKEDEKKSIRWFSLTTAPRPSYFTQLFLYSTNDCVWDEHGLCLARAWSLSNVMEGHLKLRD